MLKNYAKGRARLKIATPATVARAAEIRDQIAAGVMEGCDVEIELDGSHIDVAIIQILISARTSVRERGGSICLADPPSGTFLEVLSHGGFAHEGSRDQVWWSGNEP